MNGTNTYFAHQNDGQISLHPNYFNDGYNYSGVPMRPAFQPTGYRHPMEYKGIAFF